MQPDEITRLKFHWPDALPPADLADRIVAHAVAHPQRRPWTARLRAALPVPHQHRVMQGFAFAACIMVAVVALDKEPVEPKKAVTYTAPMEQIVEEMLWNDYT